MIGKILFIGSFALGSLQANGQTQETILNCSAKFYEADNPDIETPETRDFNFRIDQHPPISGYAWLVHGSGVYSGDVKTLTNGPIYSDGTTVNKFNEGVVFFPNPVAGIKIEKGPTGELKGKIEHFIGDDSSGWILLTLRIESCERTGVAIDQWEANHYFAKDEISDLAVTNSSPFILGVGVSVAESGKAKDIVVYVRDAAQANKFVEEFTRQGKLALLNDHYHYKFVKDGSEVSVQLTMEITGDISRP